jgi:hypothetical protein
MIDAGASAGEFSQEFLLVHVVLECLAPIDENHRNLIVELATKFGVHVDVDFPPSKSTPPGKFGEAFLDHLAEMAALTGVNNDAARLRHAEAV